MWECPDFAEPWGRSWRVGARRGTFGGVMASHRDRLIGLDRPGMDGVRITEARSGLTEAVTELRRLTRGPLFSAMPRVLADLDDAPRGSSVSVETVRMLRQCSAEHLRVADELEVAARRCRLVEEEI